MVSQFEKVFYAGDRATDDFYYVTTPAQFDALVKLTPIDRATREPKGDAFRVLSGDLVEFYDLYDINFNRL